VGRSIACTCVLPFLDDPNTPRAVAVDPTFRDPWLKRNQRSGQRLSETIGQELLPPRRGPRESSASDRSVERGRGSPSASRARQQRRRGDWTLVSRFRGRSNGAATFWIVSTWIRIVLLLVSFTRSNPLSDAGGQPALRRREPSLFRVPRSVDRSRTRSSAAGHSQAWGSSWTTLGHFLRTLGPRRSSPGPRPPAGSVGEAGRIIGVGDLERGSTAGGGPSAPSRSVCFSTALLDPCSQAADLLRIWTLASGPVRPGRAPRGPTARA